MPEHVAVLIDVVGDTGGAESLAAGLLERLDPDRYRRTLVAYQHPIPELADEHRARIGTLRRRGVQVLELERRGRADVRAWRPFLRLLAAGSVDVLHAHKFGPNVWATALARTRRPPVVVAHEHTWSFEGRPLRRLADRRLVAPGCDAFLAVSEADRRRMIDVERIPPQRVRVLANGIPPPRVPSGPDVRAELAVAADAPLVVAVGTIRPQKDLPALVRAFAIVREHVPDAHLAIVGDGPARAELEAAIEAAGMGDAVHLLGVRTDALRYVAAADVAVNASRFEGASLAILEYMALGRPIVATAVGGTPELLDGGRSGRLVAPGDERALAAEIVALLRDRDAAAALGRRAALRQRREYDLGVQVERLDALYGELLERARAR